MQAFEECCSEGNQNDYHRVGGICRKPVRAGKGVEKELRQLAENTTAGSWDRTVSVLSTPTITWFDLSAWSVTCAREISGWLPRQESMPPECSGGVRHIMDFAVVATIGNKADINETDILSTRRRRPCKGNMHVPGGCENRAKVH